MENPETLTLLCKVSDFNATTGQCAAPFYGPPPTVIPRLSAVEGLELSALICGTWAIGFVVKTARNIAST